MKEPEDEKVKGLWQSAPSLLFTDQQQPQASLHALQNQLLIELLRQSNAGSKSSSQPEQAVTIHSSQQPLDIGLMEERNARAPRKKKKQDYVYDASCYLNQVSQELKQLSLQLEQAQGSSQSEDSHRLSFSRETIKEYLVRIQSVKASLTSCNQPLDNTIIDNVKNQVQSIVHFLIADKKRTDAINQDYVEQVAVLKTKLHSAKSVVFDLFEKIDELKAELKSKTTDNMECDKLLIEVFDFLKSWIETNFYTQTMSILDEIADRFDTKTESLLSCVEQIRNASMELQMKMRSMQNENLHLNVKIEELKRDKVSLGAQVTESKSAYEERENEMNLIKQKYETEIQRLTDQVESLKRLEHERRQEKESLKREEKEWTPPSSVSKKQRRMLIPTEVNCPLVAFTGLSRHPERLQAYKKIVIDLNGRVHESADFTADISHVVAPPNYHSVRTMAAALSGKWIMSTEWLDECARNMALLPEVGFGNLYPAADAVLRSKRFYMTLLFEKQQTRHQMNAACMRTLIEPIGKGSVIDDPSMADYILCADDEPRQSSKWLRLKDFVKMIPGHL